MTEGPLPILVLVRDLLFSSRITGAACSSDVLVKVIRDPQKLNGERGRLLIVDLNQAGAIAAAIAWKQASAGVVVGFVSHTDSATIAEARTAGIDRVYARSAFIEALPRLLAGPEIP